MKYFFLLFFLTGCQDYNSNTADQVRYANNDLENNAQFQQFYSIMQNRCINCHTSPIHNSWATFTTAQKWIDSSSNRVIRGDSRNSNLVKRIINSGYSDSTMPIGGSALPNDEYDAILAWIDSL